MLSQPYAEDIMDMMTPGTVTVLAAGQRRAGADGLAVIDAGGLPGPARVTRLFGKAPAGPWPQGRCPSCGTVLDGGPVLFRCATCAKAVHAADLDMEWEMAGPQPGTACWPAA